MNDETTNNTDSAEKKYGPIRDPLYRSGSSTKKTVKESLRDDVIALLGADVKLSDDAILSIGTLKMSVLREVHDALKD